MSSWFGGFEGFASKLEEVAGQVSEQAKNALPLNSDMLEKLTLTTPEIAAARKKLDEEEKRKELIKDCLAGMLPWETCDPERDILVEECKETILKMSKDAATFKGPFLMPGLKVKLDEDDAASKDNEEEEEDDSGDLVKVKDENGQEKPTEESLDKLAKLEPLPRLLGHFDLDAHVGLIQRILAEDPDLVKMQSSLSGGGEREYYFWKNYFFHCAFARYEAGLSIDEIWNDEDPVERKAKQDAAEKLVPVAAPTVVTDEAHPDEETITFDQDQAVMKQAESDVGSEGPEIGVDAEAEQPTDEPAPSSSSPSNTDSGTGDFEKIGSAENIPDDDAFGDDAFDMEMDELEAEIARELED